MLKFRCLQIHDEKGGYDIIMFRRKKDELYEGQNDSKFDKFLKPLKRHYLILYMLLRSVSV